MVFGWFAKDNDGILGSKAFAAFLDMSTTAEGAAAAEADRRRTEHRLWRGLSVPFFVVLEILCFDIFSKGILGTS